jgi:hypothetical protein
MYEAMACSAAKFNNLKEVIYIERSPTFLEKLGTHLDALLPTIEASIVIRAQSRWQTEFNALAGTFSPSHPQAKSLPSPSLTSTLQISRNRSSSFPWFYTQCTQDRPGDDRCRRNQRYDAHRFGQRLRRQLKDGQLPSLCRWRWRIKSGPRTFKSGSCTPALLEARPASTGTCYALLRMRTLPI